MTTVWHTHDSRRPRDATTNDAHSHANFVHKQCRPAWSSTLLARSGASPEVVLVNIGKYWVEHSYVHTFYRRVLLVSYIAKLTRVGHMFSLPFLAISVYAMIHTGS